MPDYAKIESKIDFPVIRERLSAHCSSPLGREQVEALSFQTDFTTIRLLVEQTREMKSALEDASLGFPRGEIHDVREALSRIRVEGLFLDEAELFALRKTLDFAAQLERFYANLDPLRFPLLQAQAGSLMPQGIIEIVVAIDRIIDKFGRLSDHASPALSQIRRNLQSAQASVGRVMDSILRQIQAEGLIEKDTAPTLREGRLVLPVPPAYKRKIGGIVHDESATGKTVFIEPQQVVEANNRIRELEGEERRERIRILTELADWLRPRTELILAGEQLLSWTDFVRAKARLAQELKALAPQLINEPLVDWHNARHPVLYLRFAAENKTVVPLTIRLQAPHQRILVISGPNAGGKSVCLKTVALLQYMLQCGLLVPLDENSRMGIFSRLMIDIGDEQSIADDLSTYSSHLRNMKSFIREADSHTLLLIDEFGTGTEPLIGGAIAESVLASLNQQQAFGVITTHYTNLKHFAEETEGIVNGAMLYDRGQLSPLFQLSIGQAGSSFAIEIARQIGLPDTIVQHAIDLVGEEHIDYDKHLQDIARDKRYWENKRQNIRLKEKQLEEKIAFYEQEIGALKAKKKEVMEQAKQEAADLLAKSNATIERTIREIKEAKAEKTRTRQARQRVEKMKEQVDTQKSKVERQKTKDGNQKPKNQNQKSQILHDFSDLKSLTTSANHSPLTPNPVINTIRQRKRSFERQLDLRGYRADEALEAFIAYLDDAIMVNAGEVTILHGTGTGAVKQVVRSYLQERNRQRRKRGEAEIIFHDGDPDRGGAGYTVIEL